MTTLTTYHVCGCETGQHQPGCHLALAETIAHEAHDRATDQGRNGLVAALGALVEAGLLRDVTDGDAEDLLEGILDTLFEVGLIKTGGPS